MSHRLFNPRFLVVVPMLVVLALAVACGDDAAVPTPQPTATPQPTPTPIDVANLTSQIQQAVQDTLQDVTAGQITRSDIESVVSTAISAIPDPPAAVSASEIQTMVSAAVEAALPEEASAEEIRNLVTEAVAAATSGCCRGNIAGSRGSSGERARTAVRVRYPDNSQSRVAYGHANRDGDGSGTVG